MSLSAAVIIAAFVGVVAGALFGARRAARPDAQTPSLRPEVPLLLYQDQHTGKGEAADPPTISGRKHDTVIWRVDNQCAEPFQVVLRNFRRTHHGAPPPVKVTEPAEPQTTVPAHAKGAIHAVVETEPDAKPGERRVYKYEIWLKGPNDPALRLSRDPDYEPWP